MRKLIWASAFALGGMLVRRVLRNHNAPKAVIADIADETDQASADTETGDRDALVILTKFDEHVIAVAQMALDRTLPAAIKTTAKAMRDAHQSNLEKTRRLIDKLPVAPEHALADEVELRYLRRRRSLSRLDEARFVAGYQKQRNEDHERMIEFIDGTLLPCAQDRRVAARLRSCRRELAAHLALADKPAAKPRRNTRAKSAAAAR